MHHGFFFMVIFEPLWHNTCIVYFTWEITFQKTTPYIIKRLCLEYLWAGNFRIKDENVNVQIEKEETANVKVALPRTEACIQGSSTATQPGNVFVNLLK